MSHEIDPNEPKVQEPSAEPEQTRDAISDEQLDGSVGAGFCYGDVGADNT